MEPELFTGHPLFEGLPPERALDFAAPWELHELAAGELLWRSGDPLESLGLLLEGELRVELDGRELGRVRAGELVGEAGVFTHRARRSASLLAAEPSRLALLPLFALAELRVRDLELHARLMHHALRVLARRIAETDRRIAELAAGSEERPVEKVSGFQRVLRSLAGVVGAERRAPPLEPLLERLPELETWEPRVLRELLRAFEPVPVLKGEILFRQGEPGDALYLLAEGRIEVIRLLRGRRAEMLHVLEPGTLFGAVALFPPGRRTATCRVAEPGWVYRMGRAAWESLEIPARDALATTLVALLGVELRAADRLLARFAEGRRHGPLSDAEYRRILREAGALRAL